MSNPTALWQWFTDPANSKTSSLYLTGFAVVSSVAMFVVYRLYKKQQATSYAVLNLSKIPPSGYKETLKAQTRMLLSSAFPEGLRLGAKKYPRLGALAPTATAEQDQEQENKEAEAEAGDEAPEEFHLLLVETRPVSIWKDFSNIERCVVGHINIRTARVFHRSFRPASHNQKSVMKQLVQDTKQVSKVSKVATRVATATAGASPPSPYASLYGTGFTIQPRIRRRGFGSALLSYATVTGQELHAQILCGVCQPQFVAMFEHLGAVRPEGKTKPSNLYVANYIEVTITDETVRKAMHKLQNKNISISVKCQ